MNLASFWLLIEESLRHSSARSRREAFLLTRLSAHSADDIVQFQVHLDHACGLAYTWDLWGAAMRIFGGWCSDDGFEYFRLWLIGRGRDVFERALSEPDSLADFPEIQRLVGRHPRTWSSDEEWPEWESLDYIASQAFPPMTGNADDCEEAFYGAVEARHTRTGFAREPAGERWDAREEAVAELKVPRLTALFPLDSLR
jgi:hypothetical protein